MIKSINERIKDWREEVFKELYRRLHVLRCDISSHTSSMYPIIMVTSSIDICICAAEEAYYNEQCIRIYYKKGKFGVRIFEEFNVKNKDNVEPIIDKVITFVTSLTDI